MLFPLYFLCFFKGQSLLLNYHLNLIFQLSRSLHYKEGFLYTVILPSSEYDMHSVTFKITTGFSTSSSTFDWFLLRSDQDIGAREGLAELYVLLLPEELEEPYDWNSVGSRSHSQLRGKSTSECSELESCTCKEPGKCVQSAMGVRYEDTIKPLSCLYML